VTFVYQELKNAEPVEGDQLSHFRMVLQNVELSHEYDSPGTLLEAVPLREQSGGASARPDLDGLWSGGGPFSTRVSGAQLRSVQKGVRGPVLVPITSNCTCRSETFANNLVQSCTWIKRAALDQRRQPQRKQSLESGGVLRGEGSAQRRHIVAREKTIWKVQKHEGGMWNNEAKKEVFFLAKHGMEKHEMSEAKWGWAFPILCSGDSRLKITYSQWRTCLIWQRK
jgi:hypothetical protein